MPGQSWSWVEVDVLKSCLWSNHHQYLKVRKNYFEHFNELLVNCVCCWVEEDDPRQLAKKGDNCKFLWSVCNSHLKSCLLLRYPGHATWRKYSGVSDQHSESSCSWRKYLKKIWEVMLKDNAARNRIILCTNLAPFSPGFSTGSTRAFVNLDSIWIILGVGSNMSILLRKISGGTFPQVGAHWEHKCPGERFG